MRIQTLGGLSARDATGLLAGEAAQPRRLALLALLARAGDRGLSRDRLVAFLWPDTDDERARRILSQALYALRQGMGGGEAFLGTQELRLNPALVTSDVAEFESLRREGSREKAAELYGGPFLDGFHLPGVAEFERWVEDERQALAHDYAELLEQLASRATQDGDPRTAVGWWRKLASLDPLNARVAAALMRAYESAGDPAGALRHARVYQALVAQELDVPADREIVALAERIRTRPAEPPVHRDPEPAIASEGRRPPVHRGPEPIVAPEGRRPPVHRLFVLTAVAILGLAAVLLLRRYPSPAPSTVLMVGHIEDYGGGARTELGRPLADMIATDLARAPGLRVISTPRVYELLAQLASFDSTTAGFMSAARHAGATELLDGALFDLGGGRIRLDLRRVDVATGAVLGAYSVQGADPFVLADSASLQLVADLGILAPAGPIADLTTRSLAAYRAYDAGLREYFGRRFAAAEGHLGAAVRADSGFAMAWYYWA
ncbi:MAG: BTAD domain-containing putative transcriptional regulator, partial [Gemmatimonadales bacterium]